MVSTASSKKKTSAASSGEVTYPADHVPGMAVPRGGSNCAKCEYLKDAVKGLCGNKFFVKWNGSDKIPGDINEYCSDWFKPA